ncbi:MAG: polymer-forming cytoskeletal protein [Candidatus Margulisiibacteriota bacterium]|nr:polymer-forming cytoskeletal protein [Candidatus Margulisiibacteriota bacterium]
MNKKAETINSIIGEGVALKGEIRSPGTIHISGRIEGVVDSDGDVFVSSKGHVLGNISGKKVVVAGKVDGDICASQGLDINKSGSVNGEITTDRLIIEEGSAYIGRVKVKTPVEVSSS